MSTGDPNGRTSSIVKPNKLPQVLTFLMCIQGVFCPNFDRDAEYSEVCSGFSSAPGDCLKKTWLYRLFPLPYCPSLR
jgi:hypothetical protein